MNGFIAFMPIRCTQKAGTPTAPPHIVSAPESALGSHPCVALSSAQVNSILPQVGPLPKGRFLHEATNPISGRFLFEATGQYTAPLVRTWELSVKHRYRLQFLRTGQGIRERNSVISPFIP